MYIHRNMCTQIHRYIDIHTHIQAHTYPYTHIDTDICIHRGTQTHTDTHRHTHRCTHIHTAGERHLGPVVFTAAGLSILCAEVAESQDDAGWQNSPLCHFCHFLNSYIPQ